MSEPVSVTQQLMLQSWMSAAFPIGAYSCSHGMETAIQDGRIRDTASCQEWILGIITHGSGWNDSIILRQAWSLSKAFLDQPVTRAIEDTRPFHLLQELNALSLALQAGAERHLETTRLAHAFLAAANAWGHCERIPWCSLGSNLTLPVVTGSLGALHDIPVKLMVASSLQASTSNLAWIATRLVPLGQNGCLEMIADMTDTIEAVANRAVDATLDDLGSSALLADLASLQHEHLHSRVCQT